MGKFKNRLSYRLQSWNYGLNATYFVTICTYNRQHFFGEIVNGKMNLSKIGKIVEREWEKSFDMRPDMNLTMDEYVVMPNHFHAIIDIGQNTHNDHRIIRRDTMHCVQKMQYVPDTDEIKNEFGPQSKNLASIIRGFKSSVTIYARKNGNSDFKWQKRFHDHIIRDAQSFGNIQNYVVTNPENWHKDRFY